MSFGIDALTDDQLLELLQEACVELGKRDPMIRNLAQAGIATEAETIVARRAALEKAIEKEQRKYLEGIRKEAEVEVRKAAKDGSLRLVSPTEEAEEAVESDIRSRIAVIDEVLMKAVTGGDNRSEDPPDFYCRIGKDNTISMSWRGQRLHWNVPAACPFVNQFFQTLIKSWLIP